MKPLLTFASTMAAAAFCMAQPVHYSVTILNTGPGHFIPYAMSPSGVIAGVKNGNGGSEAFTWHGGFQTYPGPTALGTWGYGVNDAGMVVGSSYSRGVSRAFVADPSNGLQIIDPFGSVDAVAYGVNSSGVVVGTAATGNYTAYKPFRWHNGIATVLPLPMNADGVAIDINDLGSTVGSMRVGETSIPVAWLDSQPVLLPLPSGFTQGSAFAISESGLIVGSVDQGNPILHSGAVLWSNGTALPLPGWAGDTWARAEAVNSAGQVVGHARGPISGAVTWIDGSIYTLDSLLDGVTSSSLSFVGGIDDFGRIVAYGELNGVSQLTVLLTPIPAPGCGMAIASLILLRRPRR